MKLKSLLSLLLIVTLLLCLPLPVAAEDAATEEYTSADGHYRYILENGEATITHIEKSALEAESIYPYNAKLHIPATIDGYLVKKIGNDVAANGSLCDIPSMHALTGINLIISDGIEHIGNNAFYDSQIFGLSLPNTLLTVGDNAFSNNFFGAPDLPESLTTVGADAFSSLMGSNEFSTEEHLKIPKALTSIGKGGFGDFCDLVSITVDPENPAYHTKGNCLIETATKTLMVGCEINLDIPRDGSVTTIGRYALSAPGFYIEYGAHIAGSSAFFIPAAITKIEDYAFEERGHMDAIIYEGTKAGWDAIDIGPNNNFLTQCKNIRFLGRDTTPTTTEAPTTTAVPTTTTTTKAPTTTTTTKAPTTTKSTTSTTTTTTATDSPTTTDATVDVDVTTTIDTETTALPDETTTADVAAAVTTPTTATPPPAPKGQFPWWVLLFVIPATATAGVGVTIVVLKKRRSDA